MPVPEQIHVLTLRCCIGGGVDALECGEKGFVPTKELPDCFDGFWYCINHRGKDQFTRKDEPPDAHVPML